MANISEYSGDLEVEMWTKLMEKTVQKKDAIFEYAHVIIMVFIFVTSLLGNLLTCVVIYADRSMHTATNYYLFNLAASDLMLTFSILIEIFDQLLTSRVVCMIHWFSVSCLWNNTVLTITALSIERYVAIWHPLVLNSTKECQRVVKIIALLWLLAFLETAPEMMTVDLIITTPSPVCFTIPTPLSRVLNGVQAILSYIIPLIIMSFVYSTILFKVNLRQKKNSLNQTFNHKNPRRKVNRLMIAMTVSFFLCWTPYFIVRILIALLDTKQLNNHFEWWSIIFKVVNINGWLSTILNPILFSLMSTKFRKSLKCLWNSKIKRTVV